jgi:CDP-glycerol glycerophosphotransferase (TagB/SpsB family)
MAHRFGGRARRSIAALLSLGLRVAPVRRHIVVYGVPSTEGNAVEIVRALLPRYDGDVYWLDAPSDDVLEVCGLAGQPRLRPVARRSLSGVRRYLTAEIVFFTHGLYGNPAPPSGRTFVNLWHGDGIKANDAKVRSHNGGASATYVVGSTSLLTARKAADMGLDASAGALITGNPRTDQFRRPPSRAALERLGLASDRPFVIWMPTFRIARQSGLTPGWSDSAAGNDEQLARQMQRGVQALARHGVSVAVRFHPFDDGVGHLSEAVTLSDEELRSAGVPLYAVLGAAGALISDYSSVVTDFLLLDRPLGFVIPDRAAYVAGRGIYPRDALDWLPGQVLETAEDFEAFAADVLGEGRAYADARRAAKQRLGLNDSVEAAEGLLDQLAAREAARGRPLTALAGHDHPVHVP